jgi:hypothetical protein
MAKAPAVGRSKTRLCPPCSFEEAARLAKASLADTLTAVAVTRAARRVLVLDGEPGPWLPAGVDVIPQRGWGLDERLAAAFEDTGGSAFLIGMDTPQVTPALLEKSMARLCHPPVDAVLGRSDDGGYWGIGLKEPDPDMLIGVPMSRPDTYAAQRHLLIRRGLLVAELPRLRDVDLIEDAWAVASAIPRSRFARTLREMNATRLQDEAG